MNAAALQALIECPVCFQVPRNNIFACINSHRICRDCYEKIEAAKKQCPQGNCPYDKPPRRCRDLDAIVENGALNFSCNNVKVGRAVVLDKKQLEMHEKECGYRKVPCPVTRCTTMIILNVIDSHIVEAHKNSHDIESPEFVAYKQNMDVETRDWDLNAWFLVLLGKNKG